jgi:ABC-type multidrug transport system ATPase subunit
MYNSKVNSPFSLRPYAFTNVLIFLQDLHLDTATVRESLRFSAMLRRPKSVSKREKFEFVEEVIKILGMEEYANAVVGIPGEGLNVEQRKLLTIGVELVAKPKLLLFLDEPTSGLDSQSAWAICIFLRKLADAGQAVLCTIHQPNAILFQQFDRLLFLAEGGKTVYFGDIGKNSQTLLGYFERNGSRCCGDDENPAEFMLEIVAEGVNRDGEDWHSLWKASQEHSAVQAEIERIHELHKSEKPQVDGRGDVETDAEFAMPFTAQVWAVTQRISQQYWRMPSYIFSKLLLGIMSGLFIGFTFFQPEDTLAGIRDVIFAVFMVTAIFTILAQQVCPAVIPCWRPHANWNRSSPYSSLNAPCTKSASAQTRSTRGKPSSSPTSLSKSPTRSSLVSSPSPPYTTQSSASKTPLARA